ncbi:DoxX family protein [Amycolatopsis rubida]|uniref:DoxX-like family protein n=1 Tax=Amycolatopsis rubida TaxID=112413 RepID=A0A1I5QW23_9PSEU|nr:DoxX family protein [Amycolatopsis rubida]SFP50432.1 DoxX-like family protein [Amycolatopsis rubida]
MEIALWTAQVALALLFALSGAVKSAMSRERLLKTGQTGVAAYPMPVVRFAAICELVAVLGLILPRLTGIAPVLTGWAAVGLAVVMAGAMAGHWWLAVTERRPAEYRNVAANVVILAVCVFVAAGRL